MEETKQNLRHKSQEELFSIFTELNEPSFRAKQTWQWMWEKGADSISDMTNLPTSLREKLSENYAFFKVKNSEIQESNDGTIKTGFLLYDNRLIEGVLIPKEERMTACISSQVGCSLTCSFCATARLPRMRNLYFDEIFDQVWLLNQLSKTKYNKPLSNIVYMGMGEPLLNYKEVIHSIERITSPDGLGMSPQRITVSTAGIAKMISRLGEDKVKFNLAVSLHAPTDEKRSTIMPINDTNQLDVLATSLVYFYEQTGTRITFEYVLLKDFNDSREDAHLLASFCKKIPSKVNLIEYNQVEGTGFEASSGNAAYRFKSILEERGVIANIRRSRGKDIDAACGQLAGKKDV